MSKSTKETLRNPFVEGLRDGIPIAMGYFAVSFSLGIIARQAGLVAWQGFVGSLFTRASAGEYGTYTQIALDAAYLEVVALCIVSNLRYLLMSTALTQKFAPRLPLWQRLITACCVTDEIFGISIARAGYLPPSYPIGASLVSGTCWAAGCATGIVAGQLLPTPIVLALSVSLYGMFLAIIIPPAHKDRAVLWAVVASFALGGLCSILPWVKELSAGTRIILLTIIISAVVAWLKPIADEDDNNTEAS